MQVRPVQFPHWNQNECQPTTTKPKPKPKSKPRSKPKRLLPTWTGASSCSGKQNPSSMDQERPPPPPSSAFFSSFSSRGQSRHDPIFVEDEDGTPMADPSESVRQKYELQTVAALQGRRSFVADGRNGRRKHPSSTTTSKEKEKEEEGEQAQGSWLQRVGSSIFCKRPGSSEEQQHRIVSSRSGETLRASSSSSPTSTASNNNTPMAITDASILTALQGLDDAEQYAQRASTSSSPSRRRKVALQMYQSHLGILVQVLTGGPAARRGISYDVEVLGERVKAAMTEAESLKARLTANETVSAAATAASATAGGVSTVRRPLAGTTNPPPRTSPPKPTTTTTSTTTLNPRTNPYLLSIGTEIWTQPSQNTTTWTDVAGLTTAKRSLQEAVILPLLRPDLYTGLRTAPRGILLYGPPGTGKTLLAKAAAHEGQCHFFACSPSTLTSKWMGEGEKLLKTLFQLAREASPSIVFFDEMDSLLSKRKTEEHEASRRFKTEFMVQVDGVVAHVPGQDQQQQQQEQKGGHVLVLGCTNCPWDLDDAVLRRFQRRIYVPLPDAPTRLLLLNTYLNQNVHNITKRQISTLVQLTEGCSGSDLKAIANEASFGPIRSLGSMEEIRGADLRRDVRPISVEDYREAIRCAGKTVSKGLLRRYEEWQLESGAR